MTAFLIVLAVLLFLLLLPIGAHVIYDENGVVVRAVFGLIQIQVVPGKPKKPKTPEQIAEEKRKRAAEKAEKKRKKQIKKLQKREKPQKKKPLGALLEEFLPLIRLGLHALADLRRLPTIHKLTVRVTYGGADAAQVAMNYGLAWSIIGAGMALLGRALRIKKQDVQALLDYDCREMRVTADAVVTCNLLRILCYLVHYGVKALKILVENKKKTKAVQQNESSSS